MCDGGQCIGGGLILLSRLNFSVFLCLHAYLGVFVVFIPTVFFPLLRSLCDGESKDLEELLRKHILIEDCRLC